MEIASYKPENGKVLDASNEYRSTKSRRIYIANSLSAMTIRKAGDSIMPAGLQTVSIGTVVTKINSKGFQGCTGLVHVGSGSAVTTIGDQAFQNCSHLASCSPLENKLNYIGAEAFLNCLALTGPITLTMQKIGTAVPIIGVRAFKGCTALSRVVFSSGVSKLSEGMFQGCTGLSEVAFGGVTYISKQAFMGCSNLRSAVLHAQCNTIGDEAFSGCAALNSFSCGAGLTSIGVQSFAGCGATTLDFSKAAFTSVSNQAFKGSQVKRLVLPATITSPDMLASNCLQDCRGVTVVMKGMTGEQMAADDGKFNRFGAADNVKFVSSDDVEYELNDNGVGLNMQNTSIYLLTVALEYPNMGANSDLRGMYLDCTRIENLVRDNAKKRGRRVTVVRISNDRNSNDLAPTTNNVIAQLRAAQAADPGIFIFHYSGHGGADKSDAGLDGISITNGRIVLSDSSIYNDALFAEFAKFNNRLFAIFCCCYPTLGGVLTAAPSPAALKTQSLTSSEPKHENLNLSIGEDFVRFMNAREQSGKKLLKAQATPTLQALIWAAGRQTEGTYMTDDVGHDFMTAICETYDNTKTYAQQWTAAFANPNSKTGGVVPQKTVFRGFDETVLAFT